MSDSKRKKEDYNPEKNRQQEKESEQKTLPQRNPRRKKGGCGCGKRK